MVLHEKGAKHIKNCETILRQDKPLLEKTKLKEFEIKYSVAIACHSSVKAVDHLSGVVKEYSSKSALENIRLHRTKCTKLITNVVAKSYYEELTY